MTAALPMAVPPPVGGQRHGSALCGAAAAGGFRSPGKAAGAGEGGSVRWVLVAGRVGTNGVYVGLRLA